MLYRDYRKLRQKASARLSRARIGGIVAVRSGDWREMVAACKENDAAYLADCAAQDMLNRVTDLPKVK